ncbi:hypothetical protein ABT095_32220 [Kitasatospora sp. NPDC002227]|uniref:hypothetical protein n=1 Tax=Kitasatospora sp. NPDC002227 TaxID=3154773 RepID=UPI00331FE9C7
MDNIFAATSAVTQLGVASVVKHADVGRVSNLVVLRGRLWVSPASDPHSLQCVASADCGKRCGKRLERERVCAPVEVQLGALGYVEAYVDPFGWLIDGHRWLSQLCMDHAAQGFATVSGPELRPFHGERDAAYIRSYRIDARFDQAEPTPSVCLVG